MPCSSAAQAQALMVRSHGSVGTYLCLTALSLRRDSQTLGPPVMFVMLVLLVLEIFLALLLMLLVPLILLIALMPSLTGAAVATGCRAEDAL
jgi:hypothetical protein